MRRIDCLVRLRYIITIYQFYILGLFRWNSYTNPFIPRELYRYRVFSFNSHSNFSQTWTSDKVVVRLYSQCGTSAQLRMLERWTEKRCIELHVADRCRHPKIEAHGLIRGRNQS